MATAKTKKVMVTIKIGSYKTKGPDGKERQKIVYSSIDQKKAEFLGLKGKVGGEKVIRTINKGRAKGAKYNAFVIGVRGKGMGLVFLEAGKSSNTETRQRNLGTKTVRVPIATGTPLEVVAKFAQSLKRKPIAILSRRNVRYYVNNSANAQGGK
jgi:hypothetical protein